jgi:hypothetical protein
LSFSQQDAICHDLDKCIGARFILESDFVTPTDLPNVSPSSSAILFETVIAAILLGWVQPIFPSTPQPAARQNFGICVVFPEPVSPDMMTTGLFEIESMISSFLDRIGRASLYIGLGRLILRHDLFLMDL